LIGIDEDPWGLSYKIALNKLKPVSHSICETLPRDITSNIIDALFPSDIEHEVNKDKPPIIWQEEYQVTRLEILKALEKVKGNKKTPGPDGILEGVLVGVSGDFWRIWSSFFMKCLKEGFFPASWKVAKLVLLKKKEGEQDNSGIYRPICY